MGDSVQNSSEDQLLAQAIALSLESQGLNKQREGGESAVGEMASRPAAEVLDRDHYTADQPQLLSPQGPPLRHETSQSTDSVLADPEDSLLAYQREVSLVSMNSPPSTMQRSSPDLGIAGETDIDPLSGTVGALGSSRTTSNMAGCRSSPNCSATSSPESDQHRATAKLTLDGQGEASTRGEPVGQAATGQLKTSGPEGSYQLPLARLSSLHEFADANARVWTPNKDALELIIGMGISENAAKRALYFTGNENAELAVGWVFENINREDLHERFEPPLLLSQMSKAGTLSSNELYMCFDEFTQSGKESFKMVLVVNSDLKMGVGKVAAQVGHAVLALYRLLNSGRSDEDKTGLEEWERNGAKKIVVKGKDAAHLIELKRLAGKFSLPSLVVQDAGRTQVEPGSLTVLAVFGRCKDVDTITGQLKLL